MNLIINKKDITLSEQSVKSAYYYDNSFGRMDSLEITFNDTYDLWRKWELQKGDTIQCISGKTNTGMMYVSAIMLTEGYLSVRALSVPISSLDECTYTKENIKKSEIIHDIGKEVGFYTETYGIQDYTYSYVQRIQLDSFRYLNEVLSKDGDVIKLYNEKIITYNEKMLESASPKITLEEADFIKKPCFETKDNLVSKICNSYHEITTNVESGKLGKKVYLNMPCSSIGESLRFSYNEMRNVNKYEFVGFGLVTLDITAGITINIEGDYSYWSGNNFVYKVVHDLIYDNKKIFFRKTIEGDY